MFFSLGEKAVDKEAGGGGSELRSKIRGFKWESEQKPRGVGALSAVANFEILVLHVTISFMTYI